jgi:hypothetical protein
MAVCLLNGFMLLLYCVGDPYPEQITYGNMCRKHFHPDRMKLKEDHF